VLSALTVLVFWTGLPAVASGSIAPALTERDTVGRFGRASQTGLGLALVAVAAAVVLAIVG